MKFCLDNLVAAVTSKKCTLGRIVRNDEKLVDQVAKLADKLLLLFAHFLLLFVYCMHIMIITFVHEKFLFEHFSLLRCVSRKFILRWWCFILCRWFPLHLVVDLKRF